MKEDLGVEIIEDGRRASLPPSNQYELGMIEA